MKIYLFNPENGVYLGEDFADQGSLKSGRYSIPDDATMIPPPEVKRGEVPVFNRETETWEVVRLDRNKWGIRYLFSHAIGY